MAVEGEMNQHKEHELEVNDRAMFGFWIYLMTDLLMFAVLFAVYEVLHGHTLGGEVGRELFSLPLALTETLILLTSSFTCGVAMIAARKGNKKQVFIWFGATFALGLAFLGLELKELVGLMNEGHTLRSNAFLSSFFVLVGTHGLHIISGLLWIAVILAFLLRRALNAHMVRKLALLSLFWHFLDIVWIFIFSMVYLRAFV
jgi:cytochrome o ubiquinol oxidase subunit III